MNFVPLVTTDYKYAFCQATNQLPRDLQQHIWNIVQGCGDPVCPCAPTKRKPNPITERLRRRGRNIPKELFC